MRTANKFTVPNSEKEPCVLHTIHGVVILQGAAMRTILSEGRVTRGCEESWPIS